jgi:hypothetical protein
MKSEERVSYFPTVLNEKKVFINDRDDFTR